MPRKYYRCGRAPLEQNCEIKEPFALVSFRDPGMPKVVPHPDNKIVKRLDISCHDLPAGTHGSGLRPVNGHDALAIWNFVEKQEPDCSVLFQCNAGVGRSVACLVAFEERDNLPGWEKSLEPGTHNISLRDQLRLCFGLPEEPNPLVSMVIRLKYPTNRMAAFYMCMARQRHRNWELIGVTDGPSADHAETWKALFEVERVTAKMPRLRDLIETPEVRGLWGHPYRQLGIAAATGDWIGLSNDDNYYTPNYLEVMLRAAQQSSADLVVCDVLHSYRGWKPTRNEPGEYGSVDVGAWLARRDLMDKVPWSPDGDMFHYDGRYFKKLCDAATGVARVTRPLFIHN